MIKSVTITNYLGESIELELANPYKTGIYVSSITGLGPGKANINTTDIATDDGSIFNSARSEERNIVMKLGFLQVPGITETIEDARQLTYKYFPKKKPLIFNIITDNYNLNAYGYTESNEPDIFSKEETTQISIICPDPLFYSAGPDGTNITIFNGIKFNFEFPFENDSVGEEVTAIPGMDPLSCEIVTQLPEEGARNRSYFLLGIHGVGSEFEFPFENFDITDPTIEMGDIDETSNYYREYRFLNHNWVYVSTGVIYDPRLEMGIIEQYREQNVFYAGTAEIGVVIELHAIGPVGDVTIYNAGTREVMAIDTAKLAALTGHGIIGGDTITISTVKGNKYIELLRSGVTYNILNVLDKNADWFQLAQGDNVFTFVATTGAEYIQLTIANQVAFEGV